MIDLSTAFRLLLEHVPAAEAKSTPLSQSLGLILATSFAAPLDSPPFDKALMDGYAVQSADVATGSATLRVIGLQTAGQVTATEVTSGTALQIMTGAPLPRGADCVVRIEDTRRDGEQVVIAGRPLRAEANLIRQGASMRKGEVVLQAGSRLTPSRIGLLAEMGISQIATRSRPTVAVLATGDELVPIDVEPGPGQIRNTNEAMLLAQVLQSGGVPVPLGIARDNREELEACLQKGLQHDILVLSGGVSAGLLDLVPSQLAAARVQEIFHKVNIKPGKPVWFGRAAGAQKSAEAGRGCVVFGLPGNPVSSMVCFELFVRTAIRRMMGATMALPRVEAAKVLTTFRHRSDRPTYHPARLAIVDGELGVDLLPWQGSSDLRCTEAANGMAVLEAGERSYFPSERVEVISWSADEL